MIVTKPREANKAVQDIQTNFYAILGTEGHLKRQYFEKLSQILKIPQKDDFNLQVFTGENIDLFAVAEAVEMMPVFSEKKFVILRDIGLYKWNMEKLKELIGIVESLPAETVLLIADLSDTIETGGQKKKIQGMFEKFGLIIDIAPPSSNDLELWVKKQVTKAGGSIEEVAVKMLVLYCEGDMTRILVELEKLLLYNSTVTKKSVQLLVTPSLDVSVFALSKALEKGDTEGALWVLKDLSASGEEAIVVLGALSSQYVTLFRAMAAEREGISMGEIMRDYSYRGRDFVVRNAIRQAEQTNWRTMKKIMEILEEADFLLKTGTPNPYLTLETTVIKLMHLQKRRRSA